MSVCICMCVCDEWSLGPFCYTYSIRKRHFLLCLPCWLIVFLPPRLQNLYDSIKNEPFKIPEDDGNDLTHTFFNPDREGWLLKLGMCMRETQKRRNLDFYVDFCQKTLNVRLRSSVLYFPVCLFVCSLFMMGCQQPCWRSTALGALNGWK